MVINVFELSANTRYTDRCMTCTRSLDINEDYKGNLLFSYHIHVDGYNKLSDHCLVCCIPRNMDIWHDMKHTCVSCSSRLEVGDGLAAVDLVPDEEIKALLRKDLPLVRNYANHIQYVDSHCEPCAFDHKRLLLRCAISSMQHRRTMCSTITDDELKLYYTTMEGIPHPRANLKLHQYLTNAASDRVNAKLHLYKCFGYANNMFETREQFNEYFKGVVQFETTMRGTDDTYSLYEYLNERSKALPQKFEETVTHCQGQTTRMLSYNGLNIVWTTWPIDHRPEWANDNYLVYDYTRQILKSSLGISHISM